MPLPPASASRKRIHSRSIVIEGWKRADNLWDLEARLTDVKDHDYPLASGVRPKGDPVHDMRVRLTINRDFDVLAAVAVSDAVPYPDGCEHIAPDYGRLAGLNLARGFRKAVGEMFAGVRGCAHLTELLLGLPAAAIQTLASEMRDTDGHDPLSKPFQLDRCHALDTGSETVRRYYPRWFKGQKTAS